MLRLRDSALPLDVAVKVDRLRPAEHRGADVGDLPVRLERDRETQGRPLRLEELGAEEELEPRAGDAGDRARLETRPSRTAP